MIEQNLPWRSRFIWGVGGDTVIWSPRLPVAPWNPQTSTAGGTRTAASGVPAGYVVRRDYNLALTLRLYEDELQELDALIVWGQPGFVIRWFPDRNDLTTEFQVYLEAPKAGESWQPTRLPGYQKVFEMELLLRGLSPTPWDLDFFSCTGP